MRRLLLAALSVLCGHALCGAAEFEPPVRLKGGDAAVKVESPGYAAPCWADVDGDGKKDLLVGQFAGGKIHVFKNMGGTKFAAGTYLKAEGQTAEVPGVWWCTSSTPQFVDIDGDGNQDILSGSYSRMDKDMAGLFQVLYGKADGTFRKAEALKGTDGEPLIIPASQDQVTDKICTRPFAVDWDSDGKLDLVVGNFAGSFYWFKGKGKGKFQPKPEQIKAGNAALKISGVHSDPFVIDWDRDGDLDLLSGSSNGGVYLAENTAGKGKLPELKSFETLIKPSSKVGYGQPVTEDEVKGPGSATRIWIDDVNGDSKLDILVGDNVTLVTPAKGLSEQEFKKKFDQWQDAFNAARTALSTAGNDPKAQTQAQQALTRLYARRSFFMQEQRTGFVWLYLQK